ncbi:uncharacterized protein LOC100204767 isoform X2 [Hydra vulgaris]|uniref:uncharacterized protein LOC100204767 isoform X2 n=1 Tax=Hydra vulgaris TaxID=6087 RepID=UPI001F5E8E99|nr:uncharacterized protein LOC100204767 [Hydra vulgaris]
MFGSMNFIGSILPLSNIVMCPANCSGNGECVGGICSCEVRFSGWSCNDRNYSYFLSFGIFFYIVCLMAIIQLVMCIYSDFVQLKRRNFLYAFRFTIQKLIYVATIFASGSRAIYFTLDLHNLIPSSYKENLFLTYYAFVMTGLSLIICFWAESFHLSGLSSDKPQFLTKSVSGFVIFNVIIYTMLVGQLVSNNILAQPIKSQINVVINGVYAFLMFFVLVFFLIYGVEIFCKVQGAFKSERNYKESINLHQLFQSRLGLIAQASLQLAVTMFLTSEVLGELWKRKARITDRNIVNIAFHIAELGCALWFPCCLWNVFRPDELWILNPRKLLLLRKNFESQPIASFRKSYESLVEISQVEDESKEKKNVCWICYDEDNKVDIIEPCNCKGGMKSVHHDCLKKWLQERPENSDSSTLCCSVCKVQYDVASDHSLFWNPDKLQFRAWAQTFFVVLIMASMPVLLFALWQKIRIAPLKVGLVMVMVIVEYFMLRMLGFNYIKAYKYTKTRSLKILSRGAKSDTATLNIAT